MAKLTVSVCATISSRAAAMSIDRSKSERDPRRCSLESGGSSEGPAPAVVGICNVGAAGESAASGRMHVVRNADTDFVPKKCDSR
jgi:hypothetical protein